MKKYFLFLAFTALLISYTSISAQSSDTTKTQGHGKNFVDKNGDGYNDNAPDHDGDGIPNGVDPDYNGAKMQKGKKGFVDLDGDGINDNAQKGKSKGKGKGSYGPGNQGATTGDGTTNQGTSTQNGNMNRGKRGSQGR